MSNEMASKDDLSKHTPNIKEYETKVVQIIKTYRDSFNGEEKLSNSLEEKMNNIQESITDATGKIRTMMCDKSHTQAEILYLREMCDKINNTCCDIELQVELGTNERETCEENMKKIKNILEEKMTECENLLKSENDAIENITNEINKYNQLIANAQQQHVTTLNTLEETHKKTATDLQSLIETNQYLKNKILDNVKDIELMKENERKLGDVLTQKQKEQEMVIARIEQNKVTSEKEILELDNEIETKLKELQDNNSNVDELKKLIEEEESINENLLKESMKLKCECRYYAEKYMEQEKTISKDKKNYLEDYNKLKVEIDVLNQEILSKEDILVGEQKLEEETKKNINELNKTLEECSVKTEMLENNLRGLETEKVNLLQSIADGKNATDCLNSDILKCNEEIVNLETDLNEIETQIVNCELEHKIAVENMEIEIERDRNDIYAKCKELETEKQAIEQQQAELLNKEENSNKEYIEIEKEIEEIQNTIAKHNEEKKQLVINLDSRILECDIFRRKVKTAQDIRELKQEELMPKPTVAKSKETVPRKRQFDDTSESSYDEGMRFTDRLMKKKALKKAAAYAKKK